jgi:hypothetical protein
MLWAPPTAAGPQEIVNKLKATPATLFDLSLARLEAMVGAIGEAHHFSAGAYYQDGELRIAARSHAERQSKAACKAIIDQLKRSGGVDPKTGDPDQPASAYASLFAYPSIDQFATDESYAETVDGMITIEVIFERASDGMICKSKLLSKDVRYIGEAKQ